MAEDLEREADDAEFIAKAFGPPAAAPTPPDRELEEPRTPTKVKQRGRPFTFKPGTRQPAKQPDVVTGELPWWATTKRGEMTKTAEHEQARMSGSKVAKRVSGAINE